MRPYYHDGLLDLILPQLVSGQVWYAGPFSSFPVPLPALSLAPSWDPPPAVQEVAFCLALVYVHYYLS